jgi:hypothetical protein
MIVPLDPIKSTNPFPFLYSSRKRSSSLGSPHRKLYNRNRKGKGEEKIALRSIFHISSFTNIQLPFVGNFSKEEMKNTTCNN